MDVAATASGVAVAIRERMAEIERTIAESRTDGERAYYQGLLDQYRDSLQRMEGRGV